MPTPLSTLGMYWQELFDPEEFAEIRHHALPYHGLRSLWPVHRAVYPDESIGLLSKLHWMKDRQRRAEFWTRTNEEEARAYSLPLVEVFHQAATSYPSIDVDREVMAGAPCIKDTRIPVYMVLDAIEYYGSLEGAAKSYPRLTLEQIKDAIGFAKLVVECPLVDEAQIAS